MTKNIIPVRKDTEREQLIPSVWRDTLSKIVESFKDKDFQRTITCVNSISDDDAQWIAQSIENYGDKLISLPNKTWETSVYFWMGEFWEVFVDLYTEEGGHSDLVLSIHVYEQNSDYIFKINSVYVP